MNRFPACSIDEANRLLTGAGSPFETSEARVAGRTLRVWKNAPPSLRFVVESMHAYGERTYLVYDNERLNYAEARARISALATALVSDYDIRKGDRVVIAMRNYPEWPIAFWAVVSVGAVVVPLNAWWSRDELAFALEDSKASLVVADAERFDRLEQDIQRNRVRAIVVRETRAGARDFDAVARPDGAAALPPVDIDPDDDATLFYTSGTTGKPKGALGTHRNVCTNIVSSGYAAARAIVRRGEPVPAPPAEQKCVLVSVPFFHVTGSHSLLATSTAHGSKLVLMHKWDADTALELIERERVNSFGGVPSMAWQVATSGKLARHDTSSVERIAYGGAPAASELVRLLKGAFPGAAASNGYGLTESSAIACSNAADDYETKPESVGPAIPICDLKIVGSDGRELPAGSVGELCILGANIVKGYVNSPTETARTFREGWLHTGDIAKIDEEGFVYILDRAKDMLIRGGENIYCVEVEDALYTHPDVVDAAVIGLPHTVLGEEPAAVVQLIAGSRTTGDALRSHLRDRIAAFKVPVRVEIRNEPLPRNENGKILKKLLREQFDG